MICDFCADPDPIHELPCHDFAVPSIQWASKGSWWACQRCFDVVMLDDIVELTEYALRRYKEKHPEHRDIGATDLLESEYRLFFANRIR